MVDLNFIEIAKQNSAKIKRDLRVIFYIIATCIILMVVCRVFFYADFTDEYVYVKNGDHVRLGWPASIYSYSTYGLAFFAFVFILTKFKQDMRNPALGVTSQGLFINQQMIRNAFVPWQNVDHVELRGHISDPTLRVFFKDKRQVLQGQFFVLKSLAKASLSTDSSIGISKDEVNGDLVKIYDVIAEKGIKAEDRMEGRPK